MLLMLAGASVFVYLRLRADLDEAIENGLRSRADDIAVLIQQPDPDLTQAGEGRLAESEESFAQVLTPSGALVEATPGVRTPALDPARARRVSSVPVLLDRPVPGIEATARLIARRVTARGEPAIVVAGVSLGDRDEALAGVLASFLLGGTVAVLLASGTGYLLAIVGLRPIEAMRQRATRVSLARADEQLPLPTAHDEVRRLGETLNEMLSRLHASFERERRFVADASHELRTPLAVLKTEIEATLHRGGHEEEVRKSLAAAAQEADHLAQLAEDLLLIARATDDRLPVRPEPVQVRELLERTAERFGDRAQQQGRTIRVDAPESLEAQLDPLRARQALGNLVDNALRYGAGDIDLAARTRDRTVELEVSDRGAGFQPDLASRAFERFARGDVARRRGGTGLGLAIVKAIAEAHGGTVAIADQASRTTLRLSIPLETQPDPVSDVPVTSQRT